MTTRYIKPESGNDYWDGTTLTVTMPADPIMYVCMLYSYYASTYSVTPGTTTGTSWNERIDTYTAATTYHAYVADYLATAGLPLRDTVTHTASLSVSGMLNYMFALKPASGSTITFVNATTISEADTSVDASCPGSVADNDILIAHCIARQTTGTPSWTSEGGGSWNLLFSNTSYATNMRHSYYWKRASSEPATYTWTHNGSAAQRTQVTISAYRGCITSETPVMGYSSAYSTTTNASMLVYPPSWAGPYNSFTGATAAITSPGDEIRVYKSPAPTSLGACDWTNGQGYIVLPEAKTATVWDCESDWTGHDANVTTHGNNTTYRKYGSNSAYVTIPTAFTTGVLAYKQLASQQDYSSYQQISFWVRISTGTWNANTWKVQLCSDTAGAVPVNTFIVDTRVYDSHWSCITLDYGAALSSTVNSIAISFTTDPGTPSVYFDQFIVCKASSSADCITHNSLIGKNTAGEPYWYSIRAIDGVNVYLDAGDNGYGTQNYVGTSENDITTYVKRPLKCNSQVTVWESGTISAEYSISGGWSDDSTQDSTTYLDHCYAWNGLQFYASTTGTRFIKVNKISCCHAVANHIGPDGTDSGQRFEISNIDLVGCHAAGFLSYGGTLNNKISDMNITCFNGRGLDINNMYNSVFKNIIIITDATSASDTYAPIYIQAYSNITLINVETYGGGWAYYFDTGSKVRLYNCAAFNATVDVYVRYSTAELFNFDTNGSSFSTVTLFSDLISVNHNGVADTTLAYFDYYTTCGYKLESASGATYGHTASGVCWKITDVFGSGSSSTGQPYFHPITQLACAANSEVTVGLWVKRAASPTITARLVCREQQLAGLTQNYTDTTADTSGNYEQLITSFTPTESGVVEIGLEFWSTVANQTLYFDDLSVTQA